MVAAGRGKGHPRRGGAEAVAVPRAQREVGGAAELRSPSGGGVFVLGAVSFYAASRSPPDAGSVVGLCRSRVRRGGDPGLRSRGGGSVVRRLEPRATCASGGPRECAPGSKWPPREGFVGRVVKALGGLGHVEEHGFGVLE